MDRIYEIAKELTAIPGVSGDESRSFPYLEKTLAGKFDDFGFTPVGSYFGIRKSKKKNAKTVLFDAHLDTIGFIVTKICDGGFLKVMMVGRTAEKNLSASEVWIYGKRTIPGVFASKPPHLQEPGESEKKLSIDDLSIDTGLSKEELEEIVRIGTFVGFKADCEKLSDNVIVSPSFDDRICAACILRALELVEGEDISVNAAFQFSAGEETGYKGAMTTAYRIAPDYAIVLDVCNAYVPGAREARKAVQIGKGCSLSYSAQTNRELTEFTRTLAEKNGIALQFLAEPGATGTNSNVIQTGHGGVPTVLLSIPLKNMHTANEVADLRDCEETAKLLAEFLRNIGSYQGVEE